MNIGNPLRNFQYALKAFKMGKNLVVLVLSILLFSACHSSADSKKYVRALPDDISVLGALPLTVSAPINNPSTPAKIELGRLLFFDPILSGSKDVACATCHHPDYGFAESLDLSIGVNGTGLGGDRNFKQPNDIPFVKRNSQSIINTAFNGITNSGMIDPLQSPMFWDLRVKSLESQALEPIKAFEEMRGHAFVENDALAKVISRLKEVEEYRRLFKKAFGVKDAITKDNLGKAIAAYERTLIGNNSRFDQYMRGNTAALTRNELEGLRLFLKDGCTKCHHGPMFSDYKPHVMGVPEQEKLKYSDLGYAKSYAFRTPSLRNLSHTYPYMHNGKLKSLENVLEFYEDLSGGKQANSRLQFSQIDPLVANLNVDFKDIAFIVEFLGALNDEPFDKSIPARVPSHLIVGGNIH